MVEERRHFIRIPYKEPIQFKLKEQADGVGSLAADIGAGGLRCNSNEFIPLESEVAVQFDLDEDNSVMLSGRVVWIQMVPFSERYQVGVEFVETDSSVSSCKKIHEFIQTRLA